MKKSTIWLWRGLAVLAFVVGLVLELLGYEAIVEGIIVAFGIFLSNEIRRTNLELRGEIRGGSSEVREEIRRGVDRIVEELGKGR